MSAPVQVNELSHSVRNSTIYKSVHDKDLFHTDYFLDEAAKKFEENNTSSHLCGWNRDCSTLGICCLASTCPCVVESETIINLKNEIVPGENCCLDHSTLSCCISSIPCLGLIVNYQISRLERPSRSWCKEFWATVCCPTCSITQNFRGARKIHAVNDLLRFLPEETKMQIKRETHPKRFEAAARRVAAAAARAAAATHDPEVENGMP
jgi:hypothetical protein